MKIAFISHRYLPHHRAGVEILTDSLARAMKRRGHEAFVICSGSVSEAHSGVRLVHDDYDGIPVLRLHFDWHQGRNYFRTTYRNDPVGETVYQILLDQRPDLVHVTSCLFLSTTVLEAAKRMRLPVIWTLTDYWLMCWKTTLLTWDDRLCAGQWKVPATDCLACMISESRTYRRSTLLKKISAGVLSELLHGIWSFPLLRPFLPRLYVQAVEAAVERPSWFRFIVNKVDALVAVNPFAYEVFRIAGVPIDRLHLIAQTIDLDRLVGFDDKGLAGADAVAQASNAGKQLGARCVRIGFIGRVNQVKGADLLVQAFRLADEKERAELRFFGQFDDDKFRQQLEKIAGNDVRIQFCGSFPPERLGQILSEIDVLVVPSRWYETGPLTIVEAFAGKVPVICTRLGQMESMVTHGVNGLVFERNSVTDLAAQLRHVIENPGVLQQFRRNIEPIRPFEAMVGEYESLYNECLTKE